MADKFKILRNILQGNSAKYKVPTERPTLSLQRQAFDSFYKAANTMYQHNLRGTGERMERIQDYDEMESVPEISKALDIMADDSLTYSENGNILEIITDDSRIKNTLEELYYQILDVDFHLWHWTRNLCKYGDHFNLLDLVAGEGVLGALELPVAEIEREEGFDENPNSLRFKWMSQHGGADYFENYQVSHMRILGDDRFLPYGKSVLDPARKLYKQLIMAEDAMLIYRITRAPERRVFYIDVANIPPKDVDSFIQRARDSLKRTTNTNSQGQFDSRFNPESILEDFFIPVRGDRSSRIETLPGGDNASAIEDIQYMQNKLFIALGVPKSYLTAEEDLSGKSTLAQEDIKFARTIQRLQKIVISELAKIGLIHLHLKGFDENDIYNFDLRLTNPSSVTELMQIELIEKRVELGERMKDSGLFTKDYVQKEVLRLSDSEISTIRHNLTREAFEENKLEKIRNGEEEPAAAPAPPADTDQGQGQEENNDSARSISDSDKAEDRTSFPYDPTGTKHLKGYPDMESTINPATDKIFGRDGEDSGLSNGTKKRKNIFSKTISDIKRYDQTFETTIKKLSDDVKDELLLESQLNKTNFVSKNGHSEK